VDVSASAAKVCLKYQIEAVVCGFVNWLFMQATPVVVKYYGWYQGATPNPTQSPGYIIMSSNLVEYSP
jgi:hypothetical protein